MIRISIQELIAVSTNRPPEYIDDVIGKGITKDGILFLDPDEYSKLRVKYSGSPAAGAILRNATSAAGRFIKAAVNREKIFVSAEEKERRMDICKRCEFFTGTRCMKCGCVANLKTRLATEHCPIAKW